jgi:hypothetical protein
MDVRLDVAAALYFFRYFFLGGLPSFTFEGVDAPAFGFSFFGFLASRLLRT